MEFEVVIYVLVQDDGAECGQQDHDGPGKRQGFHVGDSLLGCQCNFNGTVPVDGDDRCMSVSLWQRRYSALIGEGEW